MQLLLPIGLGLFGFIEPCAIGGHLVFLSTLRGQSRVSHSISLLFFTAIRTLVMGVVGLLVATIGKVFVDAQKAFWLIFGLLYIGLGLTYLLGKANVLMRRVSPHRPGPIQNRNTAILGLLFGVNIPACAAPLLLAVAAAAGGTGAPAMGFMTMALFGLALSAPLFLIVAVPALDNLLRVVFEARSVRLHAVIGIALIGFGLWAVWFGLFVDPTTWQLPSIQ
ncbi:MAG: hypothetical protein HKN85_09170 [Gammaproteobacteria bacterium]|nr:hypothetical protein [Gammaproteobacteria bacterium]